MYGISLMLIKTKFDFYKINTNYRKILYIDKNGINTQNMLAPRLVNPEF